MGKSVMVMVVAALAGAAAADTVNVIHNGHDGNYGKTVTVSLSGGLFFQNGGSQSNIWAGELSSNVDGVDLLTYCTELTQWADSGVFDVVAVEDAPDPGSSMGEVKADAIQQLFNAAHASINTNNEAAAFQAVIWEIVYDFDGTEASLSQSNGNVVLSGIDNSLFNTYAAFAAASDGDKTPMVIALTNDINQDLLTVVPLPGAAAMAGLGLAGLATRRRR